MGVFKECPICESNSEDWDCYNRTVFCSAKCHALFTSAGGSVDAAKKTLANEKMLAAAQNQFFLRITK